MGNPLKILVHDAGVVVDKKLRTHLERRVAFALGGLGDRVKQVLVRLSASSPRESAFNRCEIEVTLFPRDLRVTDTGRDLSIAVENATGRLKRSLARALERERAWGKGPPRASVARKPRRLGRADSGS
jgi:ribosome-associated translation inhibitor RaiA